ncbi:hypothetical protein OAV50_00060 [Flavobacteriaceae bacterium]|nr:hypothetical protein [Flavobacteriaceae bacterium]
MKEFKIRKEINNEITKEIDEDTLEVKSSTVVTWKENLSMGFHSEEKSTKFNYNNNGFL